MAGKTDERASKPRGRPKASEPSTSVCVWLPASQHDRLIKIAKEQEKSISALVRQFLVMKLR